MKRWNARKIKDRNNLKSFKIFRHISSAMKYADNLNSIVRRLVKNHIIPDNKAPQIWAQFRPIKTDAGMRREQPAFFVNRLQQPGGGVRIIAGNIIFNLLQIGAGLQ